MGAKPQGDNKPEQVGDAISGWAKNQEKDPIEPFEAAYPFDDHRRRIYILAALNLPDTLSKAGPHQEQSSDRYAINPLVNNETNADARGEAMERMMTAVSPKT